MTAFRRRQRRSTDPDAHRARRALQFVQLEELSLGRQALEGAELVLGNRNTLDQLRQRLDMPREPIPELPGHSTLQFGREDVQPERPVCQEGSSSRPVRDDM